MKYIAIGAGPCADLITVRGLKALHSADVVLYDRLADPALLEGLKAELVEVGKVPYKKTTSQEEINRLIESTLKQNKTIARLKGGDSMLFSRVIEEIELARSLGAVVEVIPGVTTASAAMAKCESALTDRLLSSGVMFITGHCKVDVNGVFPRHNWQAIASSGLTIVIYMGNKHIRSIAAELYNHGMHPDTAVLVADNVEHTQQAYYRCTVSELRDNEIDIEGPSIFVIGKVVDKAIITKEIPYKSTVIDTPKVGEIHLLGVGPGDPLLVTMKAANIIRDADIVYIPESDRGGRSVAEKIVSPYILFAEKRTYFFPMTNNRPELDVKYTSLANELAKEAANGKRVVYVTLGDNMLYSTAMYLAEKLTQMGAEHSFVPGIPSYVACANITKTPLGEKRERFMVQGTPDTVGELAEIAEAVDTLVLMKISKNLSVIKEYVQAHKPKVAQLVQRASMEDESVYDLITDANIPDDAGYLAVAIIKKGVKNEQS